MKKLFIVIMSAVLTYGSTIVVFENGQEREIGVEEINKNSETNSTLNKRARIVAKNEEKINLLIIPHYWLYIGNGKRLKFPTLGKARPFQKNVYATFDVYLNNTPLVIIGKNAFELLN